MRCLPPGEREAAWRSVPDRLATGQALHTDAPPTPIVDEALKRLAERVEEHTIDPFDQLAVSAQLHCVEVEAALIQHGDATMELHRGDGEADGRWRSDNVGGQRIDPSDVPRTGIHDACG